MPTDADAPPIRHIARGLVMDPRDRVLLIEYAALRLIDPARPDLQSFWFMPGGGLEPGETHVEACRRELHEEIGVADVAVGPLVALCDGPFWLFERARDARERYFLVRLPDDRIDTRRLAETEDSPVRGTRWWTIEELEGTRERIEPAGLAKVARRIISRDEPAEPVRLHWNQA